jgi:probable F420-dependent oxidoreductase
MTFGILCYADSLSHPQLTAFAQNAEANGFSTLWVPELNGRDPFVTAATVLGATSTLRVGTAIANLYARDAQATRAAAYSLADGYGDRFDLGLGLSNKISNTARGHEWLAPSAKMEDFIDRYDAVELAFQHDCHVARYLAAHGPKLLEFAAARMDGAYTYLQTLDYSAEAKQVLGTKKLHLMQPTVFMGEPETARNIARKVIQVYTTLENYHRAWRERGFADSDFIDGGSDEFIDAIIAWGDADQIAHRYAEHREKGVDHIIIMPILVDLNTDAGWQEISKLVQ